MSSTNANCWVQFWENDSYEDGGTYKFDYDRTDGLPKYINDLSEFYWDGYDEKSSNELDDSINSLKTGSSTWLYLFTQHRFQGNILKVGPGSSLPDLDEVKAPDGTNWQNTIVSFVMYDHQPDCWDTGSPTLPGDCWLKLYTGTRYTGASYTLYGADEVVNNACIDNYRYWTTVYTGNSVSSYYVYNAPRSLATGPGTWVVLYSDINYANVVGQFGPNSLVRDLSAFTKSTVMSMRIYAAAPGGFAQSATTPNVVVTIQKYQTAARLESILGGIVGTIPEVGSLISGLLGALWPTGPSTAEVWNDMVGYMQAMMEDLINQEDLAYLNTKLEDYGNAIALYGTLEPGPEKAGELANILDDLEQDQGYFLKLSQPQSDLTYLVAFGTISVLMLAERAYNYAILSTPTGATPGVDENAKQMLDYLQKAIKELTAAVDEATTGALAWRESQITMQDLGGLHTDYLVADAYTGYSVEYSKQTDAEAEQKRLQAYERSQYAQLLQAYTIPARLWGYFTPDNTTSGANPANVNFPTTIFHQHPTPETVTVPVSGLPGSSGGTPFYADLNGDSITGVTLYSSATSNVGYLTGVQFTFSNQSPVLLGKAGASTVSVGLENDEVIVALYGGNGSYVDQLYFRTSQGRDFGLGGNGGTDFSGAAPQGTDAVLASIAGTTAAGYISSLTLNWQYQAGTPYQA